MRGGGRWIFGERVWIFGSWKVIVLIKILWKSLKNDEKCKNLKNGTALFCWQNFGGNSSDLGPFFWRATLLMDHTVDAKCLSFIDPLTELTAEFIYQWNSYRFRMSRGPSNLWSFAYMFFPVSLAVPWRQVSWVASVWDWKLLLLGKLKKNCVHTTGG